jgi:formylglycine-generating enzyme required for sulfatase activity/predicted Ser/Thr protein kinase
MHDPSDNSPVSNGQQPGDATAGTGDSGSTAGREAHEETVIKRDTSKLKHDDTIGEKSSAKVGTARVAVDAPPTEFGRYRIIKELGRGAMGAVYLAEDEQLGRKVALKIPQFDGTVTESQLIRFYREARSAGNLRHSGICPVYDVGSLDGQHYISMAFIEGRPLRDFTKSSRRQDEKSVAHIVRKIALAMAEAHQQSVIHRDLKPANVMIDTKNEPVVMDFGLARRVVEDEEKLTHTGTLIGTPAYMSPEQVDGDSSKVGPSADIYSLGVILYELLTGELPFQGSLLSILKQIATKEPPSPVELHAEIDPTLGNLCLRMLAKQEKDRPDSMKAVARELSTWLQNSQVRQSRDGVAGASETNERQDAGGYAPPLVDTVGQVASAVGEGLPPLVTDTMAMSGGERRPGRTTGGKKHAVLIAATIGCLAGVVALVAFCFPAANGSSQSNVSSHPDSGADAKQTGGTENTPRFEAKAPPMAVAPFDQTTAQAHQREWARYLKVPFEREVILPERESISFVLVPLGEFLMGSSEEDHERFLEDAEAADDTFSLTVVNSEIPQHRVRITQPFYMAKYELTQEQWWAISGSSPSVFSGVNLPVENVTWNETQAFIDELNRINAGSQLSFALPTEAQWEYACRAGTSSPWSFGDTVEDFAADGWVASNSGGAPNPVGASRPNAFGLYDLHGNLWELCADWHEHTYSPSDVDDPRGPLSGTDRVYRGGSWGGTVVHCRSAYRGYRPPDDRDYGTGFRLVMSIESPQP